ncbi:hypothetical protein [Agromyces archimandritae]|uniref:Uncharacterized protein n=1 Tax=Agromyces archimandritae TaxID=2781962 RepID=A0A975FPH7_9MICO|nr:hypothetical protein [Agromyces archimandritae]QTX05904.1 hypothetical protein G127AT_06840 [Agromyces archimandritae]
MQFFGDQVSYRPVFFVRALRGGLSPYVQTHLRRPRLGRSLCGVRTDPGGQGEALTDVGSALAEAELGWLCRACVDMAQAIAVDRNRRRPRILQP